MTPILLAIALTYMWFAFCDLFRDLSRVYRDAKQAKVSATINAFYASMLSCGKCLSFWLTLALTFNPIAAALVSLGYDLYERLKLKLER